LILVFFSSPYGYTVFNEQKIWGFLDKQEPVQIPYLHYKKNKTSFVEAPYTSERLSRLLGWEVFPGVLFRLSEIEAMDRY
jgi:hypothetical protein